MFFRRRKQNEKQTDNKKSSENPHITVQDDPQTRQFALQMHKLRQQISGKTNY